MQVKINSYITTSDLTEEQAIEQAISMVEAYDVINENRIGEVVTKLYYIVPILGKILVVVNDSDRDTLGVESNILANTNISDYPLERLPASVIDYKELIVKVGSSLTMEQIFNAGQSVVEETASKSMPYKIPVLKVINYNNTDVDALVMPSIFGGNIFSSIGGIVNGGDADAGSDVIEGSTKGKLVYEHLDLIKFDDSEHYINTKIKAPAVSELIMKVISNWNNENQCLFGVALNTNGRFYLLRTSQNEISIGLGEKQPNNSESISFEWDDFQEYEIKFTWDGIKTAKVFIDNEFLGSKDLTDGKFIANYDLFLGNIHHENGGLASGLDGQIRDVKIYSIPEYTKA